MDSTTSPPISSCTSQYNVGTLDVVGVTIVWFTAFRWLLLVTLADDVNYLLCLPNPKRHGTGVPVIFLNLVFFLASPIYTIVQAVHCGAQATKLNITIMLFLITYEQIFCSSKVRLSFDYRGHCGGVMFLDIILIASGTVAVIQGGMWQYFGNGAIVLFLLSTLCGKMKEQEESVYIIGPPAFKYTVLYPVILAVFITVIVKDHNQWIPRPQTALEYFFLIARTITGSGALDIVAVIVSKIYCCFVPEVDECPDVEPGFNWYRIRVDYDSAVFQVKSSAN